MFVVVFCNISFSFIIFVHIIRDHIANIYNEADGVIETNNDYNTENILIYNNINNDSNNNHSNNNENDDCSDTNNKTIVK